MATVAVMHHNSGGSSRSSLTDSDEDGPNRVLRSSVAVVTRPPAKREREYNHEPSNPHRDTGNNERRWVEKDDKPPEPKKKKEDIASILTRTGGAYIPPARLRMMQEQIEDKSSVPYQRMAWEALKKSINGLINKVNVSNIKEIVRELFQENVVRGRGLLARSMIKAQSASPTFSHVYAALVAVVNTKFPQTGELIANRLITQFKKGFRRNNKTLCLSSVQFIAHLINQQVIHELLSLEILTILLEDPTSDSVEVAIGFLKECGQKLTELSPRGIHGVFESLKGILHDGTIDVRVQYMIEVMFAVRKDGFKEHPSITEGLGLVDEDDQITHLLSLEDDLDEEQTLHIFKADPEYLENEDKYKSIKEDILGSSSDSEEDEDSDEEEGDDEGVVQGAGLEGDMKIIDETQTNLLSLRRTIYLTIMSSLDFEECAHKVMKMSIKPGQEMEVANMIIECCSQERSYQRFYGLLGERFCHINEMWVEKFDNAFQEQYSTVHRLETNKLRNVGKFFAQLFYTDALPWTSLICIHLNEEETNSSSRIFVKIMFQELAEYMGLQKLNERLKDPFLAESFEGLLPRDNPKNTRFAINFFTSIGLGGLTDDLREHLKSAPKRIMEQQQDVESDSDSSSDSSSDSDSESDSSSNSESESEDSEKEKRKRRKDNEPAGRRNRDNDNVRKEENNQISKSQRRKKYDNINRDDTGEQGQKKDGGRRREKEKKYDSDKESGNRDSRHKKDRGRKKRHDSNSDESDNGDSRIERYRKSKREGHTELKKEKEIIKDVKKRHSSREKRHDSPDIERVDLPDTRRNKSPPNNRRKRHERQHSPLERRHSPGDRRRKHDLPVERKRDSPQGRKSNSPKERTRELLPERKQDSSQDRRVRQRSGSPRERRQRERSGSPQGRRPRQKSGSPRERRPRQRSGSPRERRSRERSGSPQGRRPRQKSVSPRERRPRQRSGSPRERRSRERSGSPRERRPLQRSGSPRERRPRQRSGSPRERRPRQRSGSPQDRRPQERNSSPQQRRPRQRSGSPQNRKPWERSGSPRERRRDHRRRHDSPHQRKRDYSRER